MTALVRQPLVLWRADVSTVKKKHNVFSKGSSRHFKCSALTRHENGDDCKAFIPSYSGQTITSALPIEKTAPTFESMINTVVIEFMIENKISDVKFMPVSDHMVVNTFRIESA